MGQTESSSINGVDPFESALRRCRIDAQRASGGPSKEELFNIRVLLFQETNHLLLFDSALQQQQGYRQSRRASPPRTPSSASASIPKNSKVPHQPLPADSINNMSPYSGISREELADMAFGSIPLQHKREVTKLHYLPAYQQVVLTRLFQCSLPASAIDEEQIIAQMRANGQYTPHQHGSQTPNSLSRSHSQSDLSRSASFGADLSSLEDQYMQQQHDASLLRSKLSALADDSSIASSSAASSASHTPHLSPADTNPNARNGQSNDVQSPRRQPMSLTCRSLFGLVVCISIPESDSREVLREVLMNHLSVFDAHLKQLLSVCRSAIRPTLKKALETLIRKKGSLAAAMGYFAIQFGPPFPSLQAEVEIQRASERLIRSFWKFTLSPRLQRCFWLETVTVPALSQQIFEDFWSLFLPLLRTHDPFEPNSLLSIVLTGVLSSHLGWVDSIGHLANLNYPKPLSSRILARGFLSDDINAQQRLTSQHNGQEIAEDSMPGDASDSTIVVEPNVMASALRGVHGSSSRREIQNHSLNESTFSKISHVLLHSKDERLLRVWLSCLAYFIRCGDIFPRDARPDVASFPLSSASNFSSSVPSSPSESAPNPASPASSSSVVPPQHQSPSPQSRQVDPVADASSSAEVRRRLEFSADEDSTASLPFPSSPCKNRLVSNLAKHFPLASCVQMPRSLPPQPVPLKASSHEQLASSKPSSTSCPASAASPSSVSTPRSANGSLAPAISSARSRFDQRFSFAHSFFADSSMALSHDFSLMGVQEADLLPEIIEDLHFGCNFTSSVANNLLGAATTVVVNLDKKSCISYTAEAAHGSQPEEPSSSSSSVHSPSATFVQSTSTSSSHSIQHLIRELSFLAKSGLGLEELQQAIEDHLCQFVIRGQAFGSCVDWEYQGGIQPSLDTIRSRCGISEADFQLFLSISSSQYAHLPWISLRRGQKQM